MFKTLIIPLTNKIGFSFMEFDDFAYPFYANELLYNLLSFLLIIKCETLQDLQIYNETLADVKKDLIIDFGLFEKDKEYVLKCKSKYIDHYFMVLEHYTESFLSGNKLLISEEKYDEFFINISNKKANSNNVLEILMRTISYIFENNILLSYSSFEFQQSIKKSNSFFYINENAGYKPLKMRAILDSLKVPLVRDMKTPKKKPLLNAKKLLGDENDEEFLKALSHFKNQEFIEELKEQETKSKKKLELKGKIPAPSQEFFTNSINKFNMGLLSPPPSG